jgi:hypothetical protein
MAYTRRTRDFKRRILVTGLTREQMYLEEQRFFSMIKPDEIKVRYYNLRLTTPTKPWHAVEERRLTVGQKISKANKGRKAGPCSPEKAKAISDAKKGKKFSEEHKAKLSEVRTGKELSAEHKASIASSLAEYYKEHEAHNKGKPHTKEHRKAISDG